MHWEDKVFSLFLCRGFKFQTYTKVSKKYTLFLFLNNKSSITIMSFFLSGSGNLISVNLYFLTPEWGCWWGADFVQGLGSRGGLRIAILMALLGGLHSCLVSSPLSI